MHDNQQLSFLQEKIEEIGSAIFYNQSEAILKLPNSIVNTVKVDDYGYVWFFVQKPTQHLNEFEQEFPAKMDFYKKGKGYFLQVSGKSYVVTDPEELNNFVDLPDVQEQLAKGALTLMKLKIQQAHCYQTSSLNKMSWWQTAWSNVTAWLRHHSYGAADNTYFPAS